MKKKLFLLGLVLLTGTHVSAAKEISLNVNGSLVKSDVPPVIVENRTLVPVRVISESLGYTVDWKGNDKPIVISKGDESLTLKIGSATISHKKISNGKESVDDIAADVAPRLIDNRVMLPVRAISEAFGEKVSWDEENRVVAIGEGYNAPGARIDKPDSQVNIDDLIGVWEGRYSGSDFSGNADIQVYKQKVKIDGKETDNYEYFLAIHIVADDNAGNLLKVYSPVIYRDGEFNFSAAIIDNSTGATELLNLSNIRVTYENGTLKVPELNLELKKIK